MAKRGLKGFIILIISVFLDSDSISLHNPLHELLHQQADDVLNLSLTVELLHSGSDGLQSLLVTEDGEEDECWVEDDVVLHQVDQVEDDEVQEIPVGVKNEVTEDVVQDHRVALEQEYSNQGYGADLMEANYEGDGGYDEMEEGLQLQDYGPGSDKG